MPDRILVPDFDDSFLYRGSLGLQNLHAARDLLFLDSAGYD